MYRLTRDDGAVLSLSGNMWEAALELAYLHGWKPAGTEAPRTGDQRAARAWDTQDYFSHDQQHVGPEDARALAGAVRLALSRHERATAPERRPVPAADPAAADAPLPEAAAVAPAPEVEGRSRLTRRNALQRLVTFAHRGGFTIGRSA